MSKIPIDLNDRRVPIAIFVMLAVVIGLNMNTFKPDSKHSNGSALAEDTVMLPADLDEQTRTAARQLMAGTQGSGVMSFPETDRGVGERDPFQKSLSFSSARAPRTVKKRRPRPTGNGIYCSAVLLGGGRPTALINGKMHHLGGSVGGYVIERISEKGVLLRKGEQRRLLPVGSRGKSSVDYPVVTNVRSSNHVGTRTQKAGTP